MIWTSETPRLKKEAAARVARRATDNGRRLSSPAFSAGPLCNCCLLCLLLLRNCAGSICYSVPGIFNTRYIRMQHLVPLSTYKHIDVRDTTAVPGRYLYLET